MSNPLLSIITINYNNREGLEKTVTSVLEQTFSDFEYLVIDGGSNDGSVAVLEQHQKRFSIWVSEEDNGIYHAMNKGITAAQGNYLLFLNSGDVFTAKTALGDFTSHASFKGDIIYGDYQFEKGEKVYPDTLYPAYFMKTSLPHQSTFFKKDVFERMGLYNEKYCIGADRAFYIKCYLSGTVQFQHVRYALTLFDLSGVSNNPEFLARKRAEDEQLLRDAYGDAYHFYKAELEAEIKQNSIPRNSWKGIVKRIKTRFKKL